MKINYFKKYEYNSIKVFDFFILVFILLLALLVCFTSPVNILRNNGITATDSSVFQTIALYMDRGLMPYKDIFDHKGPLLYFYNWLGLRIKYYKGIWFIEVFSLFVAFIFLYKIARLKCGKVISLCALIIAVTPLKIYFPGGNLTEEYALPYIAIALYIFVDFFLNQKITRKRILLSGACLGCVLMLRPNMIAIWIIFCLSVFVYCLIKREYKEILNYLLCFLMGLSLAIVPFLVWLAANDALHQMIESYIVFNFSYVSDEVRSSWSNRLNSFIKFSSNDIVILSTFCSIAFALLRKDILHISCALGIILSLLFICMSGQTYNHYGMVLIPLLVYPLSYFLNEIKNTKDNSLKFLIFMVLCSFALVRVIPEWSFLYNNVIKCYQNKDDTSRTSEKWKVVNVINKYTDPDDYITVFGNVNIFYVLTHRLSASRYSYQFPLINIDPKISNDYFNDLRKNNPKIIVIRIGKSKKVESKEMVRFINDYGYQPLNEKFKNFSLYIKKVPNKET